MLIYDALHLDGFDSRAAALLDRKRILKELLSGIGAPNCFPEPHRVEQAGDVLDHLLPAFGWKQRLTFAR